MMKLAVIFESSPFDRKGLFNAVHQRLIHLKSSGVCDIDAFCIHSRDNSFTRKVRHTPETPDVDSVTVDGIRYELLWYDFLITDHLTVEVLHKRPFFFGRFMSRSMPHLKGYDAVLAHSFTGALFAEEASRLYGTPYFVTWHGSDVHTHPWRNSLVLEHTRRVMEAASCNFFVSQALMQYSDKISTLPRKEVLYNGVSDAFHVLEESERVALRTRYGLPPQEKVVAFVGSLVSVKNVDLLQPIFHEVRKRYEGPLQFWVIGDGKLRSRTEPTLMSDSDINVRMWGDVPSDMIPSLMNCIDVLVLPSRNEGLPLVCAEAVRCGAYVVGADVGGVAEVIGKEHVVPHGDGFVCAFASKVVDGLNLHPAQSIPEMMSWEKTAAKELALIRSSI